MSKLLVVIIDGLCTETLACAHVPCLDGLGKRGVLASDLQPQHPHLTLPNLVSLFTSLPPDEHGVLSNSGAATTSPHAISLFSLLRYRQQNLAAFYSNDRLRLLFPMGSLQNGVLINSQSIRNVDREITEQAARHLQREKPDCCLLYLEGANITGTHFGFTSEPYLESVEQADRALGVILEHLLFVGAERDYVTLVVGCCGTASQTKNGNSCSPLLLAGPGIAQGLVVDQPVSLLDLAPTMASILGLSPHPDWRGRMRGEWFSRKPLEMRPFSENKSTSGRRREQLAA
ncbi:MAG: alkaline phosphatase family protein [Desulfobulbus sp.]|nr:alkaline phosphatase family protein [Desulfobulbus sp.]